MSKPTIDTRAHSENIPAPVESPPPWYRTITSEELMIRLNTAFVFESLLDDFSDAFPSPNPQELHQPERKPTAFGFFLSYR